MTDYESRIADYFHACGRAGVPITIAEALIPLAQRIRTFSTSDARAHGNERADRADDRNRERVARAFAEHPGYRAVVTTSGLPYVVILNPADVSTYSGDVRGILVPMRHP